MTPDQTVLAGGNQKPGHHRAGLNLIPHHMQAGILRYIEHGIVPGDFLQAVICNDLAGAVKHADHLNAEFFEPYCVYFTNFAPATCWGSRERMDAWHRRGGLSTRVRA